MIELLTLMVIFPLSSGLAASLVANVPTLDARASYLLVLFVAVFVVMGLLVCAWILLALGVRIGRSMERQASLQRENSLLQETAASLVLPAPAIAVDAAPVADAPIDQGMPSVLPDLHREMIRDTLTGLWTRDAILDLLRREMARATRQSVPFGLVLAKLDQFDELKRVQGEPVSEAVLKIASEHFVEGLREYDCAGRSGAEFLLIMPGWDPDGDPKRVEGLLSPIRLKPGTEDENLEVTSSIGVASFHPLTDSPYAEDLLERADMAVHAAQAAGRNRAEFAPR